MAIDKKLLNHLNYGFTGEIYCRKNNAIKTDLEDCFGCELCAGSLQGNGVECLWEDVVGDLGYVNIHDPKKELKRVSILIKKGILKVLTNKVYRMKFLPDIPDGNGGLLRTTNVNLYNKIRSEIFNIFKEKKVIGTGWANFEIKPKYIYSSKNIGQIPSGFESKSLARTLNILSDIDEGDIIWTYYDKSFYMFRVSDNISISKEWFKNNLNKNNRFTLEELKANDIGQFFKGEWTKVKQIDVPGVIISNVLVRGSTWQRIKDAPELSFYLWNKYNKKIYNNVIIKQDGYIWKLLTSSHVENIVISYLQVEYKLIVDSETVKYNQKTYECELVDSNGRRHYPQVKTGTIGNPAFQNNFCNAIKAYDPDGYPIVFFENQKYANVDKKDCLEINKNDLLDFIINYHKLFNKRIQEIIKMTTKKD